MAIQSAQSVSTRSFGGQLTRNDTQTVQAPDRSANATPARISPAHTPPASEMENLSLASDSGPATPQDQARRLRHSSVIERASNLLRNDPSKLAEFRTKVSHYRSSAISATELIDGFFSLFDTSSSELGKLIKELAEIYEDESKRKSLLGAWNDWRAINEDYPALPGPSGILPGMSPSTINGSGLGGNRVLRLKSSTAPSSRSAFGRRGAFPGSASSSNPFPPLSSVAGSSSKITTAATPWGTAAAAPSASPAGSSGRSPARKPPTAGSADAFPALPSAPKPNVHMAGLTRGTVRWDERPPQSAWVPSPGPSSGNASDADLGEPVGGSSKKGKGKKGKQTLFHFG